MRQKSADSIRIKEKKGTWLRFVKTFFKWRLPWVWLIGCTEGMKDIATVAQYIERVKAQYITEQKQNTIFRTLDEMLQYVLTHSDWKFDDDELEEIYKDMLSNMEQMAQETCGKSFEEMTDEEISAETGIPNREALLTEIHDECERQIASLLFVAVNNGKDHKALSIEEAYDLSWDFMQSYVEENIKFTVD